MRFLSINPATELPIQEYEPHSENQIEHILDRAVVYQKEWAKTTPEERVALIKQIGKTLLSNIDSYAEMMTLEMGKHIRESRSEIKKCASLCEYYATHGLKILQDEIVQTEAKKSYVCYRPLGIVLAIMPWNFPFWQVFRFGIAALLGGNYILLKHAPNVSGCSLMLQSLFNAFGRDTLSSLLVKNEEVARLIADSRVSAVTLTGSVSAGRAVATIAGKNLKKCVLELGGSDPYIILPDANINKSAEKCTESRLINSGQSCIAAKRIIIMEDIYDEFIASFMSFMEQRVFGNPLDDSTDIGPQAREDLRNKLHKQVQLGLTEGAKKLLGCKIPVQTGFYYPPSIVEISDVKNPLFREEVFGPVAIVMKAHSQEQAINMANDTVFGLGGAVFTEDLEKGEYIASSLIKAGTCTVNHMVKSDPRMPFGGIKESGFGRELAYFGPRAFMNIKSVLVH